MSQQTIDRLARALAQPSSRRLALIGAGVALLGEVAVPALGKKNKRSSSSKHQRKRRRSEQRGSRNKDRKSSDDTFPRDCRRFVLSAGEDRDNKLRHVDDDVRIELIPKGKKGGVKVLLEDDNDSPNGNNGAHLKVNPFTAKVGDKIRIVARNEVVGGCELDEIWIHCIEGRGGKVKLSDAISPEECRSDAGRVGVFEDRTVRIKNK